MAKKNTAAKIEAMLLTSGEPISLHRMGEVLNPMGITRNEIKKSIQDLEKKYPANGNGTNTSAMTLVKTSSGYVFRVGSEYSEVVNNLKQEKPTRYSRAFMETLAVIAYKQPVTKAEIEELRGVTLSIGIMRSLQEHEWIKILGHKDVPGKPAIWGTTKTFLDSFDMKSLEDLPLIEDSE